MKAKQAAFQGVLAVVGLIAAYATWQRGPESVQGEVSVWDTSKKSLERVKFQDGAAWIELWREEGAWWMRQGKDAAIEAELAKAAVADGGVADAGATMASQPPKPVRTVRANERAEKLMEKFAPFRAPRGFGVLGAEKLKELGLDTKTRTLEVSAEGTKKTFAVASSLGSPFAKNVSDGQVYLLASSLVADLSPGAQHLIDRRLHDFKLGDFDEIRVTVGKDSKAFVVSGPSGSVVAPKATPEKKDEFAGNWHDRIWNKVIVGDVLGKGEAPTAGQPTVEFKIEYFQRGSAKGFLEVAKVGEKEFFGRSEHTASWVAFPQAGPELVSEAQKLVTQK